MPVSAWIMFVFGCLVLYGGLSFCLLVAVRNRGKPDPSSEAED